MTRRLAIIGNAPVATDLSRLVDSSDHVVRFNRMPNFGRNTGFRCSDLWLCNTGRPGRSFADIELLRSLVHESGAQRLLLPAGRRPFEWNLLVRLSGRSHLAEYGRRIEKSARTIGIACDHASQEHPAPVIAAMRRFGPTGAQFRAPSTGIHALHYYCEHPDFRDHEIYALGFEFAGWRGHAWDLEAAYMCWLHDSSRLTWLEAPLRRGAATTRSVA